MKHFNKKIIFSFLLGSIISAGLTVTAFSVTADKVTFVPKNPNWNVNNIKDALNDLYRIGDYTVPKGTYFYDRKTSGEKIKRYKKIDDKYYECDKFGKPINKNTESSVNESDLIEYKGIDVNNMTIGNAGYANNNFILGDGNDSIKIKQEGYNEGFTAGKQDAVENLKVNYTIIHHHAGNSTTKGGCYTKLVSQSPVYGKHTWSYGIPYNQGQVCRYCGIYLGPAKQDHNGHWFTQWNDNINKTCDKNVTYVNNYGLECGHQEGETWISETNENLGVGDSVYSINIIN